MYSSEITNALPDIPRYFTALAEWGACIVFILNLRRKYKGLTLWKICGAALVIQGVFLSLTKNGKVPLFLWLPCMAAALMLMLALLYVVCEVNWRDTVYYGLQAFVLAEFTASFEWQIYCYYIEWRYPQPWFRWIVMAGFYIGIFYVYYRLLAAKHPMKYGMETEYRDLFQTCLVTGAVFAISNVSYVSQSTPFSSTSGETIAMVRTVTDFGGVALLYSHYIQRIELHMERELGIMKGVIQSQYDQYRISKENIELMNFKYHDMKHQIEVLRRETDPERRDAYLNRLEEGVRQYEAMNETGSAVLDTLLTSKNYICDKLGISFNCVADGSGMEFMDVMDICSIVGNALENAIEYEKQIADPQKRLIHVVIFMQNNFLIMRFENYLEDELKMKDGLPVTVKKDRGFHGYGIKSIKYTAEKYGGVISIDTKEDWFELKVLIPLPMKDAAA